MPFQSEASVFDDLADEYARLDTLLAALTPQMWDRPSAASGWTVADVVLHLTQSEELVLASIAGDQNAFARDPGVPLDDLMDTAVAGERGAPAERLLQRWRTVSRATPDALRGCQPGTRLAWAAAPLSPRTLATTRLAEHWAHTIDITAPLGIDHPDTARLRHIAWLGHRSLPYAFGTAGVAGGPVRCELTGPSGELWTLGDADAPSVISGPASEFCRVGARRITPAETTLAAEGPHAAAALRVLRNYAA